MNHRERHACHAVQKRGVFFAGKIEQDDVRPIRCTRVLYLSTNPPMPIQEFPLFPLGHPDMKFRCQVYYYTPYDEWEVLQVVWYAPQYRVVFIDGQGQMTVIPVEREFQVTLSEVFEVFGMVIHRIIMMDPVTETHSNLHQVLHEPIEHLSPQFAWIWSHEEHDVTEAPPLPEPVWEAAG